MAAFVKKVINVGAAPNDDTGDTLRQGGIDSNDNYTAIFDQTAYEIGGSLAVTYGAAGDATFTDQVDMGAGSNPIFTINMAGNGTGEVRFDEAGSNFMFVKYDGSIGTPDFGHLILGSDVGGDILTLARDTLITVAHGDVDPAVTEVQDIGSASKEWRDGFFQNAITVCDQRHKDDLGPVDGNLIELMRRLDPRIFSRKTKVVKEAVPERTELRPKTKTVTVDKTITEIIDGTPVRKTIQVEQQQPVGKMVQEVDESGTPIPDKIIAAITDKSGKVIEPERRIPQLAFVPEMEKVVIPAQPEIIAEHGRPHTGFMAQSVKALMDELGIEDWAGYAYYNDEGEDTHVLRLLEFIAPILALAQDNGKRLEVLE